MVKSIFNISLKITLEILFGLFLLWLFALIMIAASLKHDFFDLKGAVPIVEGKLNQQLKENSVSIQELDLQWHSITQPIILSAHHVVLSNTQGAFLHAPKIDIDLSPAALMFGQFVIQNLTIDRIALSLTRAQDGALQVTGAGRDDDKKPVKSGVPALITLNNLIYDLPNLENLNINDAQIIYVDEVEGAIQHFDPVSVFVSMNDTGDDRQLMGYVSLPFGDTYSANIVRLNFKTQTGPLALNVHASIQDTPVDSFLQFAPALPKGFDMNMIVDADIKAQFDNLWNLAGFDLSIDAPRGQVIAEYGGEEKLFEISDLSTRIAQMPDSGHVTVDHLNTTLNDQSDIKFKGQFDGIESLSTIAGAFQLDVSTMPQSMLVEYWPSNAQGNGAYEWLGRRMSDGDFKDVTLEMKFNRAWSERADDINLPPWLRTLHATYAFDGMSVDYKSPLTPATQTMGTGTYDGQSIDLKIDSAKIGAMDVKDASLLFALKPDDGVGTADMLFPLKGGLGDVFDYISRDPINALDHIGFDTKTAKGRADLKVIIQFPLLKQLPAKDIHVDVSGTLSDVAIERAVKNLTLSGGPFQIKTGAKQIELKGAGQLAGAPIDLQFQQYFTVPNNVKHKTSVQAKTTANNAMKDAFLGAYKEYIDGPVTVDLDYKTNRTGTDTAIDLALDMAGSTIKVQSIGLTKDKGEALTASMKVNLKGSQLRSIDALKVQGEAAKIDGAAIQFDTVNGDLAVQSAVFDAVKIGKNALSIHAVEKENILSVDMKGQYLDARPILRGEKATKNKDGASAKRTRPLSMNIRVDELQTADKASLKQASIQLMRNQHGEISRFELAAQAGRGDLFVRYNPDNLDANGLSLRVESNDAGDTLRAFNLYPNIYGGTLKIGGKPLDGGSHGDVRGKVRIDNFKAVNTPILVRLLNALSFQEPANNLSFQRLESDFEWRLGENGNIYHITNGTTAGASIGLTFDGVVNTGSRTMNIKGTAAPLSQLNNFVSNIPVIGDILTGGGGALLAATYSITGDTSDPKVSVNPLSVLTPGIIRKLLFESAPIDAPVPNNGKDGEPQRKEWN